MASHPPTIAITLLLSSLVALHPTRASENSVSPFQPQSSAESDLIDIGVLVFDPGLPDDASGLRELEGKGIFAEVRESEAIYIAVHLERMLQNAGVWGAVRVIPKEGNVDLTVSGTILTSNGNELSLDVRAVDSRGRVWLDKRYKEDADPSPYLARGSTEDPFQSLYDRIAKDLLSARKRLDDEDVQTIAAISRLRFAMDLAPVPFSDHLELSKGRYSILRLPARDDPMIARVERLRDRDRMFIDVLDEYYGDFYGKMRDAYRGWRAENYWENEAIKRSGEVSSGGGSSIGMISTQGALPWEGGGVICGTPGVLSGFEPQEPSERAAREAEAKKKSHIAVLRELGASLASDLTPHLVELEGKVLRLTGSVESQYAKWRELLREIFTAETGLPNIAKTAEPERP
jgi:hypothetical protein